MCCDLIPLVKDGIASEDSREAVEAHMKACDACRAVFGGEAPPRVDVSRALMKFRRQIRIFSAMLMMFGISFGLSLTSGSGMFYNSLIMPVIGALGYFIFRWRAIYTIPSLLFLTHGLTNFFGLLRGGEHLDFYSLLTWTVLYGVFALAGVLIAGLLHYALRKEK